MDPSHSCSPREQRLERMLPHEIEAELARAPWVLVPVGAMEWHGHHDPIGLDGLKAHGQLLRVAEAVGGVVYPSIYTGHFTGNSHCPFTYMVSKDCLRTLLLDLLTGLERDGFRRAVLLHGHYPNHIFVGRELAEQWGSEPHTLELLSLRENQLPGVGGDHAAREETSALLDLEPGLVQLERIDPAESVPVLSEPGNWLETAREHPLHGVVGVDPRLATAAQGAVANARVVEAIVGWLRHGTIERRFDR